jgi:hypothetical protein
VKTLLEIARDEDASSKGLTEVEHELKALWAKERAMKDEKVDFVKREHDIFEGKSGEEGFELGRRIERASTQKRMRLNRET